MKRREFAMKSVGALALTAVAVEVVAEVVEPGPEVCKLRHTMTDGPPCIRIKVLGVSKIEDMEVGNSIGARWQCEYELTRVDGSSVVRTASAIRLGSGDPPKSFGFDLS